MFIVTILVSLDNEERKMRKRRYENYYAMNKIITAVTTLFFLGLTHYLDPRKVIFINKFNIFLSEALHFL